MSSAGKSVAIRLSVEGAEQVRAALLRLGDDGKTALAKLNFDTSSSAGPKLFQASLEEASNAAREMGGALGPLGSVLSSVGGGYLAAGAAAGGFAELVMKSVEAAEAEEAVQRRIAAVLTATGAASGQTSGSIEQMAERISQSTLQTKDDVLNAASVLATFRNVGPDAFEKTLMAAADMSAVFGGDLTSNVQKLGLALDDPIQGMNRLKRAGLDLSPAQKEIITNLEQTGNLAGAQGALLDGLSEKLGGAGTAAHAGLAGASHDAAEAWHELLVTIGTPIDPVVAAGLEALTAGLKEFAQAVEAVEKLGNHPTVTGGWNLGAGIMNTVLGMALPGTHDLSVPSLPDPSNSLSSDYGFNSTKDGTPYVMRPSDTAAMLGPSQAAQQRQDELGKALDDDIKQLTQEGSAVGARQKFINDKLEAIAKANETTIAGLQQQQPQKFAQLSAAAGKDYDSAHADETNKKAQEDAQKLTDLINKLSDEYEKQQQVAAKALTEQAALYDQLAEKASAAFSQMQAAQDALLVQQLQGQTGYFTAVRQQNADWLADQLATLQAEEAKELADLDVKAAGYAKDSVAFAQYQQDKATIAQTYADKIAQVNAEGASKDLDVTRQQQGPLQPIINEGLQDTNQSMKQIAADGLGDLQNGLLGVMKGTESVSAAFESMTASILQDVAKMVLQQQVIAPLGNLLNGIIDGSGSGGSDILDSVLGGTGVAALFGGDGSGLVIGNPGANIVGGNIAGGIDQTSGGIGDWFSSTFSSIFGSANGNAFSGGNLIPFANGGIVDSPTVVPMALMGEAGPEAIIPLSRGSNGKLGIAGGPGGDVHTHFSPSITINGNASDDQVTALRQQVQAMQRDFFSNSVQAYVQMKSRRIA